MIANTNYGAVKGKKHGRYYEFLGVPFAAAPVGQMRWKAPVAPNHWDGIYDAEHYGPQSIQNDHLGVLSRGDRTSEDCLNLNIWTPGLDSQKRPVVVMYSGGGSVNGGNSDPHFHGDAFFKNRDVVMVFANFRMGMLGFLYLGELLGEEYQGSGSCGLMDQIFALEWVKENIVNFGGDPENVTIMGQSAGGKTVSNMMLAPSSKGLFKRVIAMSGAIQVIRDLHTASLVTNRFLQINNMAPEDVTALLELPADKLLEMQDRYFAVYPHKTGPVYDGVVLPLSLEQCLPENSLNDVSVLIGHTKEELGHHPLPPQKPEERRTFLLSAFGNAGEYMYLAYREYLRSMPEYQAWATMLTKYSYRDASVRFAHLLAKRGATVWCYRWDHPGLSYAGHGSDLPYVCNFADQGDDTQFPIEFRQLERLANSSFVNFIECGDPTTPSTTDWLPYTRSADGTRMYFSLYSSAEPFSLEEYDHNFPVSEFSLD